MERVRRLLKISKLKDVSNTWLLIWIILSVVSFAYRHSIDNRLHIFLYGEILRYAIYFITIAILVARIPRGITFGKRVIKEQMLRMKVAVFAGGGMNLLFAIFKCSMGFYMESAWYIGLGLYYLCLFGIRLTIYTQSRVCDKIEDKKEQYEHAYRTCRKVGIELLASTLVITSIVAMMIRDNYRYHYPGAFIYAIIFFNVYYVGNGIYQAIKYRSMKEPILASSKMVGLVATLMSFLALETSIVYYISIDEKWLFVHRLANTLSGAFICGWVIYISIHMIRIGSKGQIKT